jgi:hypothetical protein
MPQVMPRLRMKRSETVRVSPAPDDAVYALSDVSKGGRWVAKGTLLRRDDPIVQERPDLFEVRYRLDQEGLDDLELKRESSEIERRV